MERLSMMEVDRELRQMEEGETKEIHGVRVSKTRDRFDRWTKDYVLRYVLAGKKGGPVRRSFAVEYILKHARREQE